MSLMKKYQCRNSYSKIVYQGINVRVLAASIQIQCWNLIKATGLYLRPGVYFQKGLEYPQPKIETSVYLNATFIWGNTID